MMRFTNPYELQKMLHEIEKYTVRNGKEEKLSEEAPDEIKKWYEELKKYKSTSVKNTIPK